MKRGDLYWAEFRPRSGSEQRGRRPVIVLSHDGFNDKGNGEVLPLSARDMAGKERRRYGRK